MLLPSRPFLRVAAYVPALLALAIGCDTSPADVDEGEPPPGEPPPFEPPLVEPSDVGGIVYNGTDLFRSVVGGQGPINLTSTPDHEELRGRVSHDGSTVLYLRRDRVNQGDWTTWAVDADGSNPREISALPRFTLSRHDWAPDGSRVVFDAFGSSIHVVDLTSGESTALVGPAGDNPQHVGTARAPLWSPDGQWILFGGSVPSLSLAGLLVISPDGSVVQEVVGGSLSFANQPVWAHYDWAPSGQQVAYSCQLIEVCIVSRDGSNHRQITDNTSGQTSDYGPRWSPDGTKIATRADRNSTFFQIAVIDVSDGRTISTFGEPQTNNSLPTWSPDSQSIVFQGRSLWMGPFDGSTPLQPLGNGEFADWGPSP